MDFEVWEGFYREILSDFGFEKEEDERSASILLSLLDGKKLVSQNELKRLIEGKHVIVIGGGKNLDNELDRNMKKNVIIAADGTTTTLLKAELVPDIIVTDLDGNINHQISANKKRAIVAIHAHGDNIEKIKSWTPMFEEKVFGTVQCRPFGDLHNFGGFTDGDRSVFLAHHFRANSIRLIGFDFENVGDKPNCDKKTKLRKLQWAKKLISFLGVTEEKNG
ncbi:MAG: DUF115 domain-containing protein [Methanomassiliicoccales archaeon]|nr:MAG: DUF115 domain-containing protein [Methanomassiliicoccales archaeon]